MDESRVSALGDLFDEGSRTRRNFVVGAGRLIAAAVAPAGLISLADRAYAQTGDQPDWRFCNKCSVMFFDGYPNNKGRCQAGGAHVSQGFRFLMHYDPAKGDAGRRQYDWRFCGKCSGMFFDGYPAKGRCPAGASHSAAGWMFGLVHQAPTGWQQNAWRGCNKCSALFYDGYPKKGACTAGGGHVAQGYTFYVNYEEPKNKPQDQSQTSSPLSLNQKVLKYAQDHINRCVAEDGKDYDKVCARNPNPKIINGECTHLVMAALASAGARPGNFRVTPYSWGRLITDGSYQPGDVLQFTNTRIMADPNNDKKGTWETGTQHSSIIESAAGKVVSVIEQNANGDRFVKRGTVHLDWTITRGRVDHFRPV
jgi:hypothetical protein